MTTGKQALLSFLCIIAVIVGIGYVNYQVEEVMPCEVAKEIYKQNTRIFQMMCYVQLRDGRWVPVRDNQ